MNGDPTLATREKGRIIFEAVVRNFVRMAREFKNRPRGERVDYHHDRVAGLRLREFAMKITDVEAIHLRLPQVDEIADGTQDVLIIRIHTDAGLVGIGEVSSQSYVCKAIFEAPRSAERRHGLAYLLRGQDPLATSTRFGSACITTPTAMAGAAPLSMPSAAQTWRSGICAGKRWASRCMSCWGMAATGAFHPGLCQLPVRLDAEGNRRTRAAGGRPGAHRDEVRLGTVRPEPYSRSRACGGGPPFRREFERSDG